MIEFLIELANTQTAQLLRMVGYFAWCVSLWALALTGFENRWRFRYVYLGGSFHLTIVSVWSALIAIGINLSGREFNFLLSLTTGFLLVGAFWSWFVSRENI